MQVRVVYNFYFEYRLPQVDPAKGLDITITVPNRG
jgi:hypothetical protein